MLSARDTGSQTQDPVGAHQHSITSFEKKKKKIKHSFHYGFTLATQKKVFNTQYLLTVHKHVDEVDEPAL